MANIYLAGSSQELARALRCADMLDTMVSGMKGHGKLEITNRWWDTIIKRGDANPVDAAYHERLKYANDDLQGVKDADILWLLYPTPGLRSVGCFWEAGYADALGVEVLISGPGQESSIFTTRGASFATDEGALEYLQEIAFLEGTTVSAELH